MSWQQEALGGVVEGGGDIAFGVIPGGTVLKAVLDAALEASTSFTGVQAPTASQLGVFAGTLSGPFIGPLAVATIYDWWRADGWAGGKSVEVLLTVTEMSAWPGPAQTALAYYWFAGLQKWLPGKGGWAGKKFWGDKLKDIKAGKPTTITIKMLLGPAITKQIKPGPMYSFKTPLAQAVYDGKALAWENHAASKGLAAAVSGSGPDAAVGGLLPMSTADMLKVAKSLLTKDKIGVMAGALLLANNQVHVFAKIVDMQAESILANDFIVADGGAKSQGNYVGKVGITQAEADAVAKAKAGTATAQMAKFASNTAKADIDNLAKADTGNMAKADTGNMAKADTGNMLVLGALAIGAIALSRR
jgi:hypothetical protein